MTGNCAWCKVTDVEVISYIDVTVCNECFTKNEQLLAESRASADSRVQANKNMENVHFEHLKMRDNSIRLSTDIFNAKIASITELKKAIDADDSIEQKHFKLAEVLNERYQRLTSVIFDKRQEVVEAENEQRAIQHYYNELSKKLKAEEREKIKLADLEYKPESAPVKVKATPKPKKYDKTGIAAQALLTGIPEVVIQMVCVQNDITPEAAVMLLKEKGLGKK